MPDSRKHRGPNPQDQELFADSKQLALLKEAAQDYSWLLERGYSVTASLKLVGDHFQLKKRQRLALMRAIFAITESENRKEKRLTRTDLKGEVIRVDLFNALITLESALSGGIIVKGSDSTHKDLASVHGSYRRVEETKQALLLIESVLLKSECGKVYFYLDRPVSNSGKLAGMLENLILEKNYNWQVELSDQVDRMLIESGDIVATSDHVILDSTNAWFDLVSEVISENLEKNVWLVDFST